MKPNLVLKSYLILGFILCGIAGGLVALLFQEHSPNFLADDATSTALFVGSILLCLLILKDSQDVKKGGKVADPKKNFKELIRLEFHALGKELRSSATRMGLLAYFLWASSQYILLILFTDFDIKYTSTVIMMMLGYLTGVGILGLVQKAQDQTIIRFGFLGTFISFACFFLGNSFLEETPFLLSVVGFLYSLGNAFLSPSMLSLFSKERSIHRQGKGFGLIVSADSFGFLVGSILVILIYHLHLQLEYVFLVSLVLFLLSWVPYAKYEKSRKDLS